MKVCTNWFLITIRILLNTRNTLMIWHVSYWWTLFSICLTYTVSTKLNIFLNAPTCCFIHTLMYEVFLKKVFGESRLTSKQTRKWYIYFHECLLKLILQWYYVLFSLQKLDRNCYIFQMIAIYNDQWQINGNVSCKIKATNRWDDIISTH